MAKEATDSGEGRFSLPSPHCDMRQGQECCAFDPKTIHTVAVVVFQAIYAFPILKYFPITV